MVKSCSANRSLTIFEAKSGCTQRRYSILLILLRVLKISCADPDHHGVYSTFPLRVHWNLVNWSVLRDHTFTCNNLTRKKDVSMSADSENNIFVSFFYLCFWQTSRRKHTEGLRKGRCLTIIQDYSK